MCFRWPGAGLWGAIMVISTFVRYIWDRWSLHLGLTRSCTLWTSFVSGGNNPRPVYVRIADSKRASPSADVLANLWKPVQHTKTDQYCSVWPTERLLKWSLVPFLGLKSSVRSCENTLPPPLVCMLIGDTVISVHELSLHSLFRTERRWGWILNESMGRKLGLTYRSGRTWYLENISERKIELKLKLKIWTEIEKLKFRDSQLLIQQWEYK